VTSKQNKQTNKQTLADLYFFWLIFVEDTAFLCMHTVIIFQIISKKNKNTSVIHNH